MDESSRDFTPHARTGVRRVPWKTVLAGAGGALTVGALGAAGLAPLLAGLGVGAPAAASAVVAWLTGMGMNALAGWVGDLAAEGLRAPFAADELPDPAWLAEVGRRLDAAAAADATLAAELARLLMTIDAVSQSLAALAEELGAQSDVILEQYALLKKISADIPLDVLRRSESIELLRKHRPGLSDADKLAQELGDLPLALHLAGRFLAGIGRNVPVARYLEELRSPRLFERLPLREQDGRLPTGHNRDVARTFALSYERLNPQDAGDGLALQLLARAAHLVPGEVVPADLLRATLEQPDDDLDAQLASEAALDRVVGLGLIEREGEDGLRMHRLVGAYVRQVSADATAQAAVERVVGDVAGNLADAPTLAPIAAFLPLLRGVTDTALGREDVVAATLCIWLGRHLDRLGLYATAQPYLERALAIREGVLGPEHPAIPPPASTTSPGCWPARATTRPPARSPNAPWPSAKASSVPSTPLPPPASTTSPCCWKARATTRPPARSPNAPWPSAKASSVPSTPLPPPASTTSPCCWKARATTRPPARSPNAPWPSAKASSVPSTPTPPPASTTSPCCWPARATTRPLSNS